MRVGFAAVAVAGVWGNRIGRVGSRQTPAFTATPDGALAAAKSGPSTNDVAILREDEDVRFDDRGRRVERWRLVFVVRSQTAAGDWRTLYRHWHPFYQDRPSVRARAVAPDGKATEPSMRPRSPTRPPAMQATRETSRAPSRLQPGSVVEEEVVTTDRVPIIGAGGGVVFNIGTDRAGPRRLRSRCRRRSIARSITSSTGFAGVRPRTRARGGPRELDVAEIGATTELVFESFAPSDGLQATICRDGVGTDVERDRARAAHHDRQANRRRTVRASERALARRHWRRPRRSPLRGFTTRCGTAASTFRAPRSNLQLWPTSSSTAPLTRFGEAVSLLNRAPRSGRPPCRRGARGSGPGDRRPERELPRRRKLRSRDRPSAYRCG